MLRVSVRSPLDLKGATGTSIETGLRIKFTRTRGQMIVLKFLAQEQASVSLDDSKIEILPLNIFDFFNLELVKQLVDNNGGKSAFCRCSLLRATKLVGGGNC